MATIQEVFDALKEMDQKNDASHGAITQEMRALSEREVRTETRVDHQEKRCNRRGNITARVLIGIGVAAIGALGSALFVVIAG